MDKGMEKEKNMIIMVNYYLMVNIKKEKGGMGKDIMEKTMSYMN